MSDELAVPKLSGWLDGLGGLEQRQTRWLTPNWVVEALGEFDLDPCGAPNHELAKTTYLLENGDDGLRDPWFGRVWCNPPYGREARAFIERMVDHNHGTLLIFATVETATWRELVWGKATAILFPAQRFNFMQADGIAAKTNAGKPSALIAYGQEDALALRHSGIPGRLVWNEYTEEVKKKEDSHG